MWPFPSPPLSLPPLPSSMLARPGPLYFTITRCFCGTALPRSMAPSDAPCSVCHTASSRAIGCAACRFTLCPSCRGVRPFHALLPSTPDAPPGMAPVRAAVRAVGSAVDESALVAALVAVLHAAPKGHVEHHVARPVCPGHVRMDCESPRPSGRALSYRRFVTGRGAVDHHIHFGPCDDGVCGPVKTVTLLVDLTFLVAAAALELAHLGVPWSPEAPADSVLGALGRASTRVCHGHLQRYTALSARAVKEWAAETCGALRSDPDVLHVAADVDDPFSARESLSVGFDAVQTVWFAVAFGSLFGPAGIAGAGATGAARASMTAAGECQTQGFVGLFHRDGVDCGSSRLVINPSSAVVEAQLGAACAGTAAVAQRVAGDAEKAALAMAEAQQRPVHAADFLTFDFCDCFAVAPAFVEEKAEPLGEADRDAVAGASPRPEPSADDP